jgi:RNA polymerase sigma-70 factor (ECF subfamily)
MYGWDRRNVALCVPHRRQEVGMQVQKHLAVRAVQHRAPADADVLDELYRTHAVALLALCRRRLGDAHLAEDACHEALLKAHRARDSFRAEQPMWPWLATIARNVCTDMQRRQSRVTPAEPQHLEGPAPEADPEELADRAIRRQLLVDALTSLPAHYREPVYLKHFEGWTYEQIAAHDRTSLAAVRTRLTRGRRELRARVEDLARRRGQWPLPVAAPLAWFRLRAARTRAMFVSTEGAFAPALANLAPFAVAAILAGVPTAGPEPPVVVAPRMMAAAAAHRIPVTAGPQAVLTPSAVLAPGTGVASPVGGGRVAAATPSAATSTQVPGADRAWVDVGPVEVHCTPDNGPVFGTLCGVPSP